MFHHVKIQAGIPKTFDDTNSSEQGIIMSLTLVGGQGGGLALDPAGGWIPRIAQSKTGVWGENQSIPGRILQGINEQNVTEEMQGIAVGDSVESLGTVLVQLRRMVQLARDFWQTTSQIEPVYLNVWFLNAPGPQYALIYNIDVAEEMDKEDTLTRNVALTIEREPYWRPLPPGSNPKLWTYYKLDQKAGIDFQFADLSLRQGNGQSLYTQTVNNRHEWDSADYITPLSQNYIEIEGKDVEGDVSPLIFINGDLPNTGTNDFLNFWYLGIAQTEPSYNTRDGDTANQTLILNAGDADIGDGFTTETGGAGNAVFSNGSNVTRFNMNANGASFTDAYFRWPDSAGTSHYAPSMNLLNGTYMVFLRYDIVTGTLADIDISINFWQQPSVGTLITHPHLTLGPLTPQDTTSGMYYFGSITLPILGVTSELSGGLDIYSPTDGVSDMTIEVRLNSTSAIDIDIWDLVLMPIQSGSVVLRSQSTTGEENIFDSTGYIGHGRPTSRGAKYNNNTAKLGSFSIELRGDTLNLMPGVDNRLYMIWQASSTADSDSVASYPGDDMTVELNLIPRWRSVRDV